MRGLLTETVLNEAGAVPALIALHRSGSLLMKEFVEATGLSFTTAKAVRERLVIDGLVTVEAGASRGAREEQRIQLTDRGRLVARHLSSAADEFYTKVPSVATPSEQEEQMARAAAALYEDSRGKEAEEEPRARREPERERRPAKEARKHGK